MNATYFNNSYTTKITNLNHTVFQNCKMIKTVPWFWDHFINKHSFFNKKLIIKKILWVALKFNHNIELRLTLEPIDWACFQLFIEYHLCEVLDCRLSKMLAFSIWIATILYIFLIVILNWLSAFLNIFFLPVPFIFLYGDFP